jgi:hypothetical protein
MNLALVKDYKMTPLITALAPIMGDLVKRLIPDGDKSKQVEKEIKLALLEHTDSLEALRGQIVLEEAKSTNWLTASWRPLLMMVIIAIVALNYLFFPVTNMFLGTTYSIDLPSELWSLLQIGVGGYIVGRSGEKMVDKWKQ